MPSIPIARESVSALLWHKAEAPEATINTGHQNSIYSRGLLQPRRGQADPNGITTTENVILVITIVLFLGLMLSFIWYLMSTGKEMNELGGIGAGREKTASTITIKAPADPPEQKPAEEKPVEEKSVEADSDSSSGSSSKESVSESDKYWLWWTRRENKMEDEEAATGPQSRNRSPESRRSS